MEQQLIEKLKVACNQFYLGKDLDKELLTDKEFDQLRSEYEASHGSVKFLVDWELDMQFENDPMDPLEKIISGDNDLKQSVFDVYADNNISKGSINYKYDGSSIIAHYKDGKLVRILGTPDVQFGFIRTKAFWNLFPHEVDKDIKSIQGEVLVDAEVYGQLARNKANGLTNSKYKDDEVEAEAFIRAYCIQFHEGDWTSDRNEEYLAKLPSISLNRVRPTVNSDAEEVNDLVFAVANNLEFDEIPSEPIVTDPSGVKFQVDGVVIYSSNWQLGIKFYYTESAITTVTEIEWTHQVNGSFVPKLVIEPIELNEKCISRVASGGFPNLRNNQMGKGSKVRVILANMTIPKVIEVIEPSTEYQIPKCDCGYQLTENDLYGSSLKCASEDVCNYKLDSWYLRLVQGIVDDLGSIKKSDGSLVREFKDYFKNEFDWFMDFLYIDRWSSYNKRDTSKDETEEFTKLVDSVYDAIMNLDIEKFEEILGTYWNYTDLNWDTLLINAKSTMHAIKKVSDNWSNLDRAYLDSLYESYFS